MLQRRRARRAIVFRCSQQCLRSDSFRPLSQYWGRRVAVVLCFAAVVYWIICLHQMSNWEQAALGVRPPRGSFDIVLLDQPASLLHLPSSQNEHRLIVCGIIAVPGDMISCIQCYCSTIISICQVFCVDIIKNIYFKKCTARKRDVGAGAVKTA